LNIGDHGVAIWSEDGQSYDAEVKEFDAPSNHYLVLFTEYGNMEWITPDKFTKK
jgi:hypothetical protein